MASIESLTMWLLLAMLALQSASATCDDPPRELFSEDLPTYIPRLVTAEHNKLHFVINIDCKCFEIMWEYKMEKEGVDWRRRTVFCSKNKWRYAESCDIPSSFNNLRASSTYLVRAMLVNSNSSEPYLSTHLLPNSPFTETVHAVTCSANVAAIEDLQVYSAGSRWVVISWWPPKSLCHTKLQYEVRVRPVMLLGMYGLSFVEKGIFWSDSPWTVEKPTMSCITWPDRHCLLIQSDNEMRNLDSDKEYHIDVRVKRFYNEETSKIIRITANITTFIPSPPTDLHCQWILSEGLEVRWRAPLRPGGVLTTAHVRITHGHDHPLYERHMNISSVVNYTYVHRVNVTLEEDQQYDVFVCFGTSSYTCGEEAHVAVWRPSLTIASLTKRKDTETMDGENVTETIDRENVTEAINGKNVIENMTEAITTMTETIDGENVITEAITTMTETIDGENVITEAINVIETMDEENMTDVVVKETVIAYGGGNVLWGVVFMLFMGLLVVGVFLAIRRWGSRWACLSRDADQLATPTNTPIMTSIQESRV